MTRFDKFCESLLSEEREYVTRTPGFSDYVAAALWSSSDKSPNQDPDDDNSYPLDDNYDIGDIDRGALRKMDGFLSAFLSDLDQYLETLEDDADVEQFNDEQQIAHDLWLTQNGHGAGFWDGDWGDHGDHLTKLAKRQPEVDLYIGDDNRIYLQ